ncbi:MAG TPA: ATP-binding cassette domain-containing protein [Syntrophobacteraceae bacterium]|nr:ATP-binding cassette domain-containing protein [Syntrophobacteraceae bacterium]
MEAEDRSIFRLRNLVKVREKGGACFELRTPFLTIDRGQFVALVGQSGCGKSTLLDVLALVLRATSAEQFALRIHRHGHSVWQDVVGLPDPELADIRRSQIGYVLQSGGLLPFLTVRENILLTCRLNGLGERQAAVDQLAEQLGITDQLSKKPRHLSGGQRQRAAIARALAHRPPIVLADEPTAAADRHTAVEIRDVFKALTRRMGVTLLMVTHDEALIEGAVDRTFEFVVERLDADRILSTVVERF